MRERFKVWLERTYPGTNPDSSAAWSMWLMRKLEVYEANDLILPLKLLPDPCHIRVQLTNDKIALFVGPRDWSWDRRTGLLIGAGSCGGCDICCGS